MINLQPVNVIGATIDVLRLCVRDSDSAVKFLDEICGKRQITEEQWSTFAALYKDAFGKFPLGYVDTALADGNLSLREQTKSGEDEP